MREASFKLKSIQVEAASRRFNKCSPRLFFCCCCKRALPWCSFACASTNKTWFSQSPAQPAYLFFSRVPWPIPPPSSLLEDMTPPVNPPAEIDDPSDFNPADRVDATRIKV